MAIIYAFGDSITYGAWDIQKSGWVSLLRQYLDELQADNSEYYGLVYNLGIPGETTDGLVKRFEVETKARERDEGDAVFIFAFGANDSAFLPALNKFRVSKEDFKDNLAKVIGQALSITSKIVLVNILPVVESKNSISRNGKVRLNKYIQEYNDVLNGLAKKFGLRLIDVYSKFVEMDYEDLFDENDGLHPNDNGHQFMFEIIKPFVQELIGWY